MVPLTICLGFLWLLSAYWYWYCTYVLDLHQSILEVWVLLWIVPCLESGLITFIAIIWKCNWFFLYWPHILNSLVVGVFFFVCLFLGRVLGIFYIDSHVIPEYSFIAYFSISMPFIPVPSALVRTPSMMLGESGDSTQPCLFPVLHVHYNVVRCFL